MTIRARQRFGTLVGRVGEVAELDRGLERVGLGDDGSSSLSASRESARRGCWPSSVSAPNSAVGWCSMAALPSSSATSRSAS
jgi:hypothetical protein